MTTIFQDKFLLRLIKHAEGLYVHYATSSTTR
ncbi:hypothetical protein T03_3967 [Trichinella britovi]|uniref:Uncharacterized protein n=1 Tax=Trichinella britovi TaxID=45882 RepID=A0A0V0YWG1_TRIBR|nr:hypothetical protein T03_3967 [Trichinella britovi]